MAGRDLVGPVTAKLCKSAKGARDAEMGLHPAQLWTESAFGEKLGPKVVAIAPTLTGVRDPLDRRSVKSSPPTRRTPPGLPPAREMARTHSFAVTGPTRRSRRDRRRAKLREVKDELRRRMHHSIPEQGHWLKQVVTGYFAYHAVPTNIRALMAFRHHVTDLWRRTLRRRSQKDDMTWARMQKLVDDWLPQPRILHPWPSQRFAVKHPR